jgi:Putative DNA-binding domain
MRNERMCMPSLHELQLKVMHAVLGGEPESAVPLIATGAIPPARILGVYADTALANFTGSLIASYPAIWRLVGEDYFRQAARGFHTRHPSASGDLQPAGTHFAQYLAQLHGAGEYRYLGEVARLEWLIQESLLAGEHAPFDLEKLAQVAPADYDALRFTLHPSARLFASEFPCINIWEANVHSDAEPQIINLKSGPDRALLCREHGQLLFHRLSEGEYAFLSALHAGGRFAAAVENGARHGAHDSPAGADTPAGFDAAAALQRFVLAGSIVDFQ